VRTVVAASRTGRERFVSWPRAGFGILNVTVIRWRHHWDTNRQRRQQ
jgi:hypothetical protein